MKRFFLLFLICVVSACSRPSVETLSVTMSLGEEEWQVFRKEIFPRFEEEFSVKVKAYQIESGQLSTKLEALQLAGKTEIDVFAQDNMSLATLINKGLVLNLSDYENKIHKKILPNLIAACKFKGKLMFLPFRPNVQVVYYNSEAFNKYNLKPPQDWNQLLKIAKRFKEEEGTGRFLIKAFGGNPTATQVYEYILQAGGNPYTFNDAGSIRAFQFLQRLKPYFSPESNRAKWDTVNDILAKREAYLASNWPFGVVVLVKNYGLKFIKTYSGWRGPAGKKHVIGGDVFGIPKNSKNKKAAMDFILFMQSKEIQEILVSRLGWPSIRDDAYTHVESWQKPYFESVQEALKDGVFRKNVTWWPAYKKYINRAFQEIVMEGAPVKKTLDTYKAQLEKEKGRY